MPCSTTHFFLMKYTFHTDTGVCGGTVHDKIHFKGIFLTGQDICSDLWAFVESSVSNLDIFSSHIGEFGVKSIQLSEVLWYGQRTVYGYGNGFLCYTQIKNTFQDQRYSHHTHLFCWGVYSLWIKWRWRATLQGHAWKGGNYLESSLRMIFNIFWDKLDIKITEFMF